MKLGMTRWNLVPLHGGAFDVFLRRLHAFGPRASPTKLAPVVVALSSKRVQLMFHGCFERCFQRTFALQVGDIPCQIGGARLPDFLGLDHTAGCWRCSFCFWRNSLVSSFFRASAAGSAFAASWPFQPRLDPSRLLFYLPRSLGWLFCSSAACRCSCLFLRSIFSFRCRVASGNSYYRCNQIPVVISRASCLLRVVARRQVEWRREWRARRPRQTA